MCLPESLEESKQKDQRAMKHDCEKSLNKLAFFQPKKKFSRTEEGYRIVMCKKRKITVMWKTTVLSVHDG